MYSHTPQKSMYNHTISMQFISHIIADLIIRK